MKEKKEDIKKTAEEFDIMIEEFADKHGLSKETIAELLIGWLDYYVGVMYFDEGELEQILYAIVNNNLGKAVAKLSERILIPNWYDIDDLENLLGRELDDEEYEKLIAKWNKKGCWDEISEIVRNCLED